MQSITHHAEVIPVHRKITLYERIVSADLKARWTRKTEISISSPKTSPMRGEKKSCAIEEDVMIPRFERRVLMGRLPFCVFFIAYPIPLERKN